MCNVADTTGGYLDFFRREMDAGPTGSLRFSLHENKRGPPAAH
jgi:hypothetical protein